MKQILHSFKYTIVLLVFFVLQIFAEDVCEKKGPCSCEFPNGTGIDLTPSAKSTFYIGKTFVPKNNESQYSFSTYYYHPCYDVLLKMNSTNSNDSCGNPLSICRHVNNMNLLNGTTYVKDIGLYEFMGTSNVSQFSNDGKSIIYANGPASTVVMLMCAQTDDTLEVFSLEEPNRIVLAFYSRSACLKQLEEPGRSFGSTLLIIFFSCVIFYLVLGICTKKFLMGATGIEVIPNLGFWSDLPHLVKDGWAFTVNGFKLPARGAGPVTTPDPNSYDSI